MHMQIMTVSIIALASWCAVHLITRRDMQVVQRSSGAVRGLGAGLTRSRAEASERARMWLNSLEQDARKQAAVSQESLKVGCGSSPAQTEFWPKLVSPATVSLQSQL